MISLLISSYPDSSFNEVSKFNTNLNKDFFVPIECDITKPETFDNIINTIVSRTAGNKFCGLVNNAGYVEPGAIEDLAMENLRNQFETNFIGLVGFTKKILPLMMQQSREKKWPQLKEEL